MGGLHGLHGPVVYCIVHMCSSLQMPSASPILLRSQALCQQVQSVIPTQDGQTLHNAALAMMQGSKGTSSTTRMSGHTSRLMRLESSLFILPELLQQRSAEFGGLELEGFIGQGSFGRVYKGTWPPGLRIAAE